MRKHQNYALFNGDKNTPVRDTYSCFKSFSRGYSSAMIFLAFEGLDGSGKSSLMRQLENHLVQKHIEFIHTREPGGTWLGDQLRQLILQKPEQNQQAPTARTELLMYEASRAQHVDCVIQPALKAGQWVLCDRFTASSLAFQASGRAISAENVRWLNDFATDFLKPHLNVLLDLSVQESRERRQSRQQAVGLLEDRIEAEADSFHQKVRESFLKQSDQNPTEWLVLNAAESPEKLFKQLLAELKARKWLDS